MSSQQDKLPGTSGPAGLDRKSTRSWLWLALAALLLLVANGRYTVPIAAWLSLLFLLRFVRLHAAKVGLPVAWLVLTLAWAFQFRGMAPLPGILYFILAATFSVTLTVPFVVDRLLAPRLQGLVSTLVLPCSWVVMEWLVASFTPYGSWSSLAYTQHENLALLQLLAVTGIYGVSFLITWFAAVGVEVWDKGWASPSARRSALAFVIAFTVINLGGGLRLVLAPPSAPTVRIASLTERDFNVFEGIVTTRDALLRGKLAKEDYSTIRANSDKMVTQMLERAEREVRAGAKIVIWGETNGVILKDYEPELRSRVAEFARTHDVYLGMSPGVFIPGAAKPLENKFLLFEPNGDLAFEFWKARPVPGAEAAMQATDDGHIKSAASPYGRLGAAICFDMDFPRLLMQAGGQDVDIMLVPSNDWQEIDPWHSHMARMRAIEQGFNLVRHTSNGLSLAADYQGRVLATMDHFATRDRQMVAYVPTAGSPTLYRRMGDVFVWICMGALLAMAAWGSRRRRIER